MILQALTAYYERLASEETADLAPPGFERKEIPFIIVLDSFGKFVTLQDTRETVGKKLVPRKFVVPKEKGRSGSNAWQEANLLWDHYGYVLAHPKSENEKDRAMAQKQHETFLSKIKFLVDLYPDDQEILAVYRFLSGGDFKGLFSSSNWNDCKKIAGCNLSFQIEGKNQLACQNTNVREYVVKHNLHEYEDEDGAKLRPIVATCSVTGKRSTIARLHPRTPIAGSKSNAKIVSFQRNMGFDSYGREQSYNAPVSESAAFAYTTALNRLLSRDSHQKMQIGDTTTVFWAEHQHRFEQSFYDIFGRQPARGEPEQDYKHLIAFYRSPEVGSKPDLDLGKKFFVLGLAPNAARIAVRFWYAGTVGEIAENIWRHFDDLELVKGPKEWRSIGLQSLLRSTALQGKDDNVPPNLAGDTMKAILNGTPYPHTLLAAAVRRCRAEQDITYTRAALTKAILVRESRFHQRKEKEVTMALDTTNTNPGYLLGRLFSTLERAQETASPGINATIRDRFYGSASGTPASAFPTLMKLKNHHLAKIENKGYAINLERLIGEIVEKVQAADGFPTHLNLQDQGRFAVGYYHQRQDFFKKREQE